ncbi:MAG: hypothetical protein QOI80_3458 [Solirubrobacteraceae bacterium]|jgi:hypothetical protein|nr:hypothetical protein [Solirubrobacteraceae bacterium]
MRYLALAVLVFMLAGCGGSSSTQPPDPNAKEVSPAGDIPDDQAFVRYAVPKAGFTVKVPEGWSRTASGGAVTFTDKLNSITLSAQAPPAVPGAKTSSVSRRAGKAQLELYEIAGKTNPVTGKKLTDAVERYTFRRGGRLAVLTLAGPKGADNVDPWRIVTDSVRFTG